MHFYFHCPKCDTRNRAHPDQVGRSGRCKQCRAIIRVPKVAQDEFDVLDDISTFTTMEVKVRRPFAFIRRLFRF